MGRSRDVACLKVALSKLAGPHDDDAQKLHRMVDTEQLDLERLDVEASARGGA